MMKSKDLMIGDWVYVPHDGRASHNGKVESIYKSGTISVELEEAGCLCRAESLEPIPLTEKILEKNGFIYSKHEFMTLSEDMVWRIEDRHEQALVEIEEQADDNGIDYYVGTFVSGANRCEIYFRFVHELQQL